MTSAGRAATTTLPATLGLAAVCWAVSVWQMSGMNMGVATRLGSFAFFAAVWVAMMAAMMLPGAAPAVARAARDGGVRTVPLFAASYLAIWALVATQNASATGTSLEGYFSEGHGVSTFARDSGTVFHCYSSYARGTEFLMGYYAILDRAPNGRDEDDQPMGWLRRHDEYHDQ
jgi:hypothetical protein